MSMKYRSLDIAPLSHNPDIAQTMNSHGDLKRAPSVPRAPIARAMPPLTAVKTSSDCLHAIAHAYQ